MINDAEAYFTEAVIEQEKQNYNEAITLYKKSLNIIHTAKTINNLAYCFQSLGKYEKAEELYLKAIESNDAFLETYQNLSIISIAKDRPDEAFKYLMQYFRIGDEIKISSNSDDWDRSQGFIMISLNLIAAQFKNFNKIHIDILKYLLSNPEIRTRDLRGSLSFYTSATVQNLSNNNTNISWKDALRSIAEDELIISYLTNEINTGLTAENFFLELRKKLLPLIINRKIDKESALNIQIILKAMVMQSINNEYIWNITNNEYKNLETIKVRVLKNIKEKIDIYVLDILILMSYEEISSYKEIYAYLKKLPKNTFIELQEIFQREIFDKEEEKEIMKNIKSFSNIDDDISVKVKDQYEENPYPRWMSESNLTQNVDLATGRNFTDYLKTVQKNLPVKSKPIQSKKIKILIAGCGTGLQPISIANADKNVSIDAFDLSLASIAYGIRIAKQLRIKNINWFQADILDLNKINTKYDIIECSGVLHHMRDPKKGFKELEKKLKPNGLIKLGLYARHFRDNRLKSIREKAIKENYSADLSSIRKFRSYLKESDDKNIVQFSRGILDFYSSSSFRDLLLHAHEESFTIPELIKTFSINIDYKFLGFEFPKELFNNIIGSYLTHYPENYLRNNLDNWNKFEEKRPDLFASMYQFWLQKN